MKERTRCCLSLPQFQRREKHSLRWSRFYPGGLLKQQTVPRRHRRSSVTGTKAMHICSTVGEPGHQDRDKKPRTPTVGNRVAWRGAICLWPLIAALTVLPAETTDAAVDGLVLCAPGDPYRPLANEISVQTGYELVDRPAAALARDPACLVWVAAPSHFTDGDLVAYAMQARDRSSSVSLRFITGQTLDRERVLRLRGGAAGRFANPHFRSG